MISLLLSKKQREKINTVKDVLWKRRKTLLKAGVPSKEKTI